MHETLKLPRVDIQALRGLAVLLVVFYHTKIGNVAAGYLGVDIFFVISGFLITTLVASGIDRGTFRLRDFYFRRAKRLLPAAYVTFAVTAILAPWVLNQQELRDFAAQMVGAVTFTGNIVLWQQTGYFSSAAPLKPLLHIWSLAIEEQYYFLLPAALLFIKPTRWLAGAVILAALSFGLCIFGEMLAPSPTFYLLPSRVWELLIGSIGALWVLRGRTNENHAITGALKLLFIPSLLCLLVLPFMPFKGANLGANAAIVCMATLIVILRNSAWLNSAFPTKILASVGDFSYSLYLVHWPIIAFMENCWMGFSPEVPIDLRLATLVLSFVFAYALYRFIEDPIRKSSLSLSKPLFVKVALSSALLVLMTPAMMYALPSQIEFSEVRRHNYGFSEKCEYKELFAPRPECQNSENPNLMVWGDSYAMHLVAGVANEWKSGGVIQATQSHCGPFLGVAMRRIKTLKLMADIDNLRRRDCIGFNQSVMEFLRATPSIETVILSSALFAIRPSKGYEHVVQKGDEFSSLPVSPATVLASLRRTVEEIRATGKRVVLIAPPPSTGFNIGDCLERQLSGKLTFGGRSNCDIDRAQYQTKRADALEFLKSAVSDADIAVIRFDPLLCDSKSCKTLLDGTMIYRDLGHLSYAGSVLVAERMQLARLIREQAK